jgi:site-specific DNA recombinase
VESNEPPQYIVYLRKSRGRAGISRQRTITAAHIERLGGIVLREFTDTDRTAYQQVGGNRPVREDFDQMLDFLRVNPGTRVAAWHADRLLRNSEDTEALILQCAQGGHLIETPAGGSYDVGTANGRKRLRTDAVDAAYEVDHLTERVTAQKLEAAAAGLWLGGPVPFGWRKGPDGSLVLEPAEAAAIAKATADIIDHVSLHSVTRQWNAAGLTTKRGHEWHPTEVRPVLLRARNAGLHVHQGELTGVRGNWPPIVTEDQWRACRALLTDPARRSTPGNERRWLGSGLYLCGECGAGLIVSAVGGKGRPIRKVYRCRTGSRRHVARDAISLDAWISLAVIERLSRPNAAAALEPRRPDTAALSVELAAVRAELAELPRLKNAGKLTLAEVVEMGAPLKERETRLESRLAVAGQPSPLDPFREGRDPEAVWDALGLDRQRAVLKLLMTVTVHIAPKGRPPGWKPGEPYFHAESVKIEWTGAEA